MSSPSEIDGAVQKIKAGKPSPVYLVYGDQDYLVKQAYDRICEALVPEEYRAFNFEQLDGSSVDVSSLLDSLNTLPMMPAAKVLGVPDCRFLVSKASGEDILAQARERWQKGENHAALKLLGKAVMLCGQTWETVQGWQLGAFRDALDADLDEARLGGDWLPNALASGLASGLALPKTGDESAALLEGLEAALEGGVKPAGILVLAAVAADGRKKLYKFLETRGTVLEFKGAERGYQASQTASVFLRHQLAQRGLSMETQTAQRVISAYGADLGLMAKELDKMEAHAGPRKEIKGSDLEAVGSPRLEENIFDLLGAVGQRDASKALPLLRKLLELEPAQKIFAQLCQEVRLLFLCRGLVEEGLLPAKGAREYPFFKSNTHPKLTASLPPSLAEFWKKKNPYPVFQALNRCLNFKLEELRLAQETLLEADLRMKTSQTSLERLMEELILTLCGVAHEDWV